MTFLYEIARLGISNLRRHMLRSILTALGIILGVAAVIIMVSIGEGSKQQALAQIEALGAKNIIIRSQKPPESVQMGGQQQRRSFVSRYGITRDDLRIIQENFADAEAVVPLKEVGDQVLREGKRKSAQAFGTTPDLLRVARLRLKPGGRYLVQADLDARERVAIIGHEIAKTFFPTSDPVGETLRVDEQIFRVVGVLEPVGLAGGAGATRVGRDFNLDIHIPFTTAAEVFGDTLVRRATGNIQASAVQVSEVYVVAPARDDVMTYAAVAKRLMDSRHPELTDVSFVVPYELLEDARKTQLLWTMVLGAIAGISLLVGGIGIMNIMLATVTERTREIGIRRALGATRRHITWQFLVETGVLSCIGGLIGVGMGVGLGPTLSWIVPRLHNVPIVGRLFSADAGLPTQVTLWSIVVAFLVAVITGLLFGIYPAQRAARQDPIQALRHD